MMHIVYSYKVTHVFISDPSSSLYILPCCGSRNVKVGVYITYHEATHKIDLCILRYSILGPTLGARVEKDSRPQDLHSYSREQG